MSRLTFNIRKDLEKKLIAACLFIDFEKAFDSVWKKGLITNMWNIGIGGKFLALIDSFLTHRKVRLHVNDYIGVIRHCLDVGLPQGSVLSPILFKFYILDLGLDLYNSGKADVYKFADDGTFKVCGKDWQQCKANMEEVLEVVIKWCMKWRLVMNCKVDKSEIVVFSSKRDRDNDIPLELTGCGKNIRIVEKSKVLGITIDNKLDFKSHSDSVLSQLNARWVMISSVI